MLRSCSGDVQRAGAAELGSGCLARGAAARGEASDAGRNVSRAAGGGGATEKTMVRQEKLKADAGMLRSTGSHRSFRWEALPIPVPADSAAWRWTDPSGKQRWCAATGRRARQKEDENTGQRSRSPQPVGKDFGFDPQTCAVGKALQIWIRVKTKQLRFWGGWGGFGYQHLPEWVCEEVTENQLQ